MKLEVGQKIGIYEVVSKDEPVFETGTQHLGYKNQGAGVMLFYDVCFPLFYADIEVRKVGSLIVKKLK